MFKKVLVATRGEIAEKIISKLKEMQIKSVAVYSTVDANEPFVAEADEKVCIGSPKPISSYLNMESILSAASLLGCDAIHPGYGFLSENATFVELCERCSIIFIGPNSHLVKLMGNKIQAKEEMSRLKVPVVPGSVHSVSTLKEIHDDAVVGFPLLLKSVLGGGGKGISQIDSFSELSQKVAAIKKEAELSFGDSRVYVEKMLSNVKHIEVQVLVDNWDNVICFPERDCSMQRKHQKILEVTPCLNITQQQRSKLQRLVISICKSIHYRNSGTFEFLLDSNGDFYFVEMNTRLQVEYGISEEVSGVDIIKEQICIASGESLKGLAGVRAAQGFAIECRVNAEDPQKNFTPCTGVIEKLKVPSLPSVRIDSGVEKGSFVSPYYDSMIMKVIAHGATKQSAYDLIKKAMLQVRITGIRTNTTFLTSVINSTGFTDGSFTTDFLKDFYKGGTRNEKSGNIQQEVSGKNGWGS